LFGCSRYKRDSSSYIHLVLEINSNISSWTSINGSDRVLVREDIVNLNVGSAENNIDISDLLALNWDGNGQRKDILSVEDDSKELVEMRISDDGTLE
jgi:hypothetical protein